MKLLHFCFPSCLRHASNMWLICRNGRLPTASSFQNQGRRHTHIQNPTTRSHSSLVLENCWNQLWRNVSLRLCSYVVQLIPHKLEPSQRILQLMHSSERLHLLRTPSAKRRPPISILHGQLCSYMISKEHSTRCTQRHWRRLYTNGGCHCISPSRLLPSILLAKWHLDLISNLNCHSLTNEAYHRDHQSRQSSFLFTVM